MVELNVPAWAFILIWSLINIGMLAAGWFLRGWYDASPTPPPPPPEEEFGARKGKW